MGTNYIEKERTKMNTRQKISLSIIAPIFTFAVAHTVINKINNENLTKAEFHNIDKALKVQSDSVKAKFDAEQKIFNNFRSSEGSTQDYEEKIKMFIQQNPDLSVKEADEILRNYVECGD